MWKVAGKRLSRVHIIFLFLMVLCKCQNSEAFVAEEFKLNDGPQTLAWCSEAQELCYGGALGGGKTILLIIDAAGLQFKDTPLGKAAIEISDYRAILLRRKTTEFVKLIEEGRKYYERDFHARFIWGRRGDPGPSFTFPSGARIFICHLEAEANKHDHDSNEYQYIGFDQVEQFTVTQYAHLLTRGRSTIQGLPVRYRSTANWIGPGLKWVRNRFYPKGFKPFELTWWKPAEDIVKNPSGIRTAPFEKDAISRMFIPAKLTDNPILMQNDPSYASRIKIRGKKYERALLDGDPDAFSGEFFSSFNPMPEQNGGMVMEPFRIQDRWRLIASIDPGWTSPFSMGLKAIDFVGKHYRIGTFYQAGLGMRRTVKDAVQWLKSNPWTGGRLPDLVVSGHDAWAEHTKLEIIGEELTYADLFQKEGIALQRAVTSRVVGWGAWNNLMDEDKWFVFDGLNEPLIDEMMAAEHDDMDVNDIKGRGNDPEVSDHALDEERYNIMASYKPSDFKKKEDSRPKDYRDKRSFGSGWKPGEG
jgi:hypothetical protein